MKEMLTTMPSLQAIRLLLAAFIAITVYLPTAAQTANSAPTKPTTSAPTLEQEFKSLLQEIADARLRGDKAVAERRLAENFIATDEKGVTRTINKSNSLKSIRPAPAELRVSATIEEVQVLAYGDVAVVNYRDVTRLVINNEPVVKRFRYTEVFKRNAGVWQMVASHQTVIPGEAVATNIDQKVYDGYVGRYQLFSNFYYTVTREGEKLMISSPIRKAELVPENENTFVIKGDQYRIIFLRNDRGEVTQMKVREFPGVEYPAIKVK
jgi:hypothetical protein